MRGLAVLHVRPACADMRRIVGAEVLRKGDKITVSGQTSHVLVNTVVVLTSLWMLHTMYKKDGTTEMDIGNSSQQHSHQHKSEEIGHQPSTHSPAPSTVPSKLLVIHNQVGISPL